MDIVAQVAAYPFARAERACALVGGRIAEAVPPPAGATPLLSYGANASPERVAVKVAGLSTVVVFEPLTVRDLDVVFSAHVSPSGGLGAALARSEGTEVEMTVTHLEPDALAAIEATEPNYDRVTLPELGVEAYVSKHGCLVHEGDAVALAAVPARGRRFPELATIDAVEVVRRRLAPERTLEAFVVENAKDPELRAERTAVLRSDARPFEA